MGISSSSAAIFPTPARDRGGRLRVTTHLPALLKAVLLGVAYYAGAQLGFSLPSDAPSTSIFWLPNSMVFAAFLLTPPRRWWICVLAVAPAHVVAQLQNGVPSLPALALLFATNVGDGALGALLVRRFAGARPDLRSFRGMAVFLAASVAAPFVVSFGDAAVMVGTGWATDYWSVWHTRFRSNTLTNFILVPMVVIEATRARSWVKARSIERLPEVAALALGLVLTGVLVFGGPRHGAANVTALGLAPLPLFLWATVRLGPGGVSTLVFGFSSLVVYNAARGYGPFAAYSPTTNVLALQVFLTLLSAPTLLLSALLREQRRGDEALLEREAQYRSIFESTSDGVLITDLAGRVVVANPALHRLIGYDTESLAAIGPRTCFQTSDLSPFDDHLGQAATAATPITTIATCLRRDGGLVRVEVHSRRFSYGASPHVLSVVRDLSGHERAHRLLEQGVAERTRALSSLLEISRTVASTLDLDLLLGLVLDRAGTIVSYTNAILFVEQDDELVAADWRGSRQGSPLKDVRVPALSWPVALGREAPLVIDDLAGDGATAHSFREAAPPPLGELLAETRSLLVVPLRAGQATVGLLWIDGEKPGQFTLRHAQLVWALAGQAAIAIDNARRYDRARQRAAWDERQRLGRELHDSVTQTLYALVMTARVLPETWASDEATGRRLLVDLTEMASGALAQMRTLLFELRPLALQHASIGPLLQQLVDVFRSRHGTPVKLDVDPSSSLPPEVHVTFYRIAQEALNNAAKHADASSVEVSLRCNDASAILTIADDGRGFAPDAVPPDRLGVGIMRERAAAIDATLAIDSAPGRGTRVTASWSSHET
jgi:PAS domain S-box-containing protein